MGTQKLFGLLVTVLASCVCNAQSLLVDGFEKATGWATGGQKEIRVDLSGQHVKEGGNALHLHVEIDHRNAEEVGKVKYPLGWPSVRKTYPQSIDLSGYDFLEFDVYFESHNGVDPDFALNATFSDSQKKAIYRATLIDLRHGKWAHEKLCIRDIPNASDFQWASFWLSESTYADGAVIDFFIDNLRATKAKGYVPPPVRPVRHALARSESVLLWSEGSARKVSRTEVVAFTGAPNPIVNVSAARNETEAVQLVVRPLRAGGLGEVSLILGALSGPGGAVIPAENISWSPVVYVPANEGPPEGLPDGLPGPKPFVADQAWHYPIWLEVYVPPGTAAGDYAAPLTITTGSGDLRAELRLHVWDFDIPVTQHLRTSTTIYGPYGWRDDIKKWFGDMDYWTGVREWMPGIIKLLARYRLSPAHLYHLPLSYDKKQGKVVLKDTAEFERFVESYLAMGHHFDSMPVPYFFDRPSFLGAKKGTPEYFARITEAYRVAAAYLEPKGWLEGSYVYPIDEIVVHRHTRDVDMSLLNRAFDAIHAAHPKIRLFGAETPSPVLRGMNVWCVNMNAFDSDVLAEQHALGNQVWWYNGYRSPRAGTRVAARGVDHRALFWMTWKFGIDGYLIWTVNRWTNNPWEEPNPPTNPVAGDHYLLYPNPDGTVSPSLRLAMMRDGLEDYEDHWLLAQAAKRLRAGGKADLADKCERTLAKADAFVLAYDNCPHIHPNFLYDSRRMLAEMIEEAGRAR